MTLHRRHMLAMLAGALLAARAGQAAAGGTAAGSDGAGIVGSPDDAGEETLTGQVLNYEGEPIFGASVTFRSLDVPPRPIPEIGLVTGEDGRFGASLPPGRYRVTVISQVGVKKSRKTSVPAGGARRIRIWLAD